MAEAVQRRCLAVAAHTHAGDSIVGVQVRPAAAASGGVAEWTKDDERRCKKDTTPGGLCAQHSDFGARLAVFEKELKAKLEQHMAAQRRDVDITYA